VKKHDHNLDSKCIYAFCQFLGYYIKEFCEIVDTHFNKEIFIKTEFDGRVLKTQICDNK